MKGKGIQFLNKLCTLMRNCVHSDPLRNPFILNCPKPQLFGKSTLHKDYQITFNLVKLFGLLGIVIIVSHSISGISFISLNCFFLSNFTGLIVLYNVSQLCFVIYFLFH